MNRKMMFRYGLIVITLLVAYISYLVLEPFLITIILTLILAFLFYPLYHRLAKVIKSDRLASILMILLILLLLIIPATFLVTKLATESAETYSAFIDFEIEPEKIPLLQSLDPIAIDQVRGFIEQGIGQLKDYIVKRGPDVINQVASFILHLFVAIFILYFAFTNGEGWYKWIRKTLPLHPKLRDRLFKDLENSTNAIVYGQFLTAVIQGTLGGLMFFIFGIPNPIFWGFIMIIFSFLPYLGTPIIFVPAALLELVQGDYLAGIGVLVVGFVLLTNIDNLIRPFLVSSFGKIHPVIVLVGVLGGLQAFGFSGIILGPLALAVMVTLIKDFSSHQADAIIDMPKK